MEELDAVGRIILKLIFKKWGVKARTVSNLMICTPQNEKNEMGEVCSTYGESRGAYRVLVGKPEGKRPLGRLRPRWEDNIKMDH
jgi:hypothetical protein